MNLVVTVVPVAKMRAVISVAVASPDLPVISANLNWEYDCANRVHVETTAFVWR